MYTSAPKGLQPGSRGFCTVAMTRGLPAALAERLEALSGYRPLFPPHDPQAARNPVGYCHLRVTAGGKTLSVVSRVCAAGLDYTQRTNKFAHHVALEAAEQPAGGPAWLLAQPGFMETAWDEEVRLLGAGRMPPQGDSTPGPCRHWHHLTGDAGWAGVLAEAFLNDPNRPVYLLFEPGTETLPLIGEALALLPPRRRWEVTFSTYFTGLPQGLTCAWRGVVRDSAEAKAARRLPGALVLDLGAPLGQATGGALVASARTGQLPAPGPEGDPKGRHQESRTDPRAAAGAPNRSGRSPAAVEAAGPEAPPIVELQPVVSRGVHGTATGMRQKASGRRSSDTSAAWLTAFGLGAAAGGGLCMALVAALWLLGAIGPGHPRRERPEADAQAAHADDLTAEVKERQARLDGLRADLTARAGELARMDDAIKTKSARLARLEDELGAKTAQGTRLDAAVRDRGGPAAAVKPAGPNTGPPEKADPRQGPVAPKVDRQIQLSSNLVSSLASEEDDPNRWDLGLPSKTYRMELHGLSADSDSARSVEQKPEADGALAIYLKGTDGSLAKVAQFQVKAPLLRFRWEADKPAIDQVYPALRDSILEIRSEQGGVRQDVALRAADRLTSLPLAPKNSGDLDPKDADTPPRFDYESTVALPWEKHISPARPLYLDAVDVDVAGQRLPLPNLVGKRAGLVEVTKGLAPLRQWKVQEVTFETRFKQPDLGAVGKGPQKCQVRLSLVREPPPPPSKDKKAGSPPSAEKSSAPAAPTPVTVRSLVLYTVVDGRRVDVVLIGGKR
jgi:hypothetical protein